MLMIYINLSLSLSILLLKREKPATGILAEVLVSTGPFLSEY